MSLFLALRLSLRSVPRVRNPPPLPRNLVQTASLSLSRTQTRFSSLRWAAQAGRQVCPRQRTVFLLRFVEELELREIAFSTGLREGAMKEHLSRAVARVCASLEESAKYRKSRHKLCSRSTRRAESHLGRSSRGRKINLKKRERNGSFCVAGAIQGRTQVAMARNW
jgi:hypothetical protein